MPKKPSYKKKARTNGARPSTKGIGSPLGHRGISGAYGKPMAMKPPKGHVSARSR